MFLVTAVAAGTTSWKLAADRSRPNPAVIEPVPVDSVSLSGMFPGRPPFQGGDVVVKDVNGKLVGVVSELSSGLGTFVVKRIEGGVFSFYAYRSGFQDLVGWYFESPDCTGSPFISPDWGDEGSEELPLIPGLQILDGTGYYPVPPLAERQIRSNLSIPSTEDWCSPPGGRFSPPNRCCYSYQFPYAQVVGSVATVDLDALGLEPPFHVEAP